VTDPVARTLAGLDPEVAGIVDAEADRRRRTIDLIASESEPSPPVLEALGSVFAAKTAEGYPGRRYHRGTEFADAVEQLAIDRAKALFGAGHANVQPSSGVNANLAVYRALLKPGDTVLALQLAHGGHLSHGDPASITGAVYRFEHYGVRARPSAAWARRRCARSPS
jgi:Glycine/serine hydroxymethyltransferase